MEENRMVGKMKKTKTGLRRALSPLAIAFVLFCAGSLHAQQSNILSLDDAITQAAKAVEVNLSSGAKLAVLNFSSVSEAFSDYVIEEFSGALVTNKKVTVIERRSLDLIREEMNINLSGDVSDESAQRIGHQLGAQSIVSGSLTNLGDVYRFRIKVINVETARIETQVSYNMGNDRRVTFLLQENQQSAPPVVATPPAAPATSAPSAIPAAVPNATASYIANNAESFANAIKAINANTTDDSTFVIVLSGSFASGAVTFSTNAFKTITIRGDTANRTLSNNNEKVLFTVPTGIILVLDNNATLDGNEKEQSAVEILVGGQFIMKEGSTVTGAKANGISINSGIFTMNGGTITRNNRGVYVQNNGRFTMAGGSIASNTTNRDGGGGVYIVSGSFMMTGGTIARNTANMTQDGGGGGVCVRGGTFTMNGGTIRGNTVSYHGNNNTGGGGVYVRGTFTMNGGTITGNTTADCGGGVYVYYNGTFVKTGGTIDDTNVGQDGGAVAYVFSGYRRNTTAGPGVKMDTKKSGEAGGWE